MTSYKCHVSGPLLVESAARHQQAIDITVADLPLTVPCGEDTGIELPQARSKNQEDNEAERNTSD